MRTHDAVETATLYMSLLISHPIRQLLRLRRQDQKKANADDTPRAGLLEFNRVLRSAKRKPLAGKTFQLSLEKLVSRIGLRRFGSEQLFIAERV